MNFTAFAFALLHSAAALSAAPWTVTGSRDLPGPAALGFREVRVAQEAATAVLNLATFSPQAAGWAVMDNPTGDFTLATAAQKRGALAAVNGGYFHPDRTPLGLVMRQGALLHPLEHARLLSGLVVATRDHAALLRVSEFKASPKVREALQAGPFLIDHARPVAGLDAVRSAARTVVFAETSGRMGLLLCRSATLAEMAEILATPGVLGVDVCERALNLDGGSSSALWVRGAPPFYQAEGKSVRNYLAIVPH